MKRFWYLLFSLPLLFLCEFTGNMYDPEDPSYVKPSFSIDTAASNVAGGDTVTVDTLRIALRGNDLERRHNLFRWSLDNGEWTKWGGEGKTAYEIVIVNIPGGTHTLAIEVCYNPVEETTDSTMAFFRAVKPRIIASIDSTVATDAGAACTLRVKADGTGDLRYTWYRDGTVFESATADTLLLTSVSLADTGVYYCHVTSPWGEVKSPGIQVKILFLVFYDGNGNTGGMAPVDTNGFVPGVIATTFGNPGNLIRRGYSFAGWNTKADGSGNTRDSSDIFIMDTVNVTLYARWISNPSFTLAYDGNGATGGKLPDTAQPYRTGVLVAVAGNSGDLVNPGFTFTGWNTKADGSGKDYGENDLLEMGDEAIILYAQWSDNPTFNITYDGNGAESGEAPVDAKKYEEGDTVTVAGNGDNLAKPGNTFTGWNTQPQGDGGIAYTPGAAFIMSAKNVTLYARWTTRPVYTLTYLGNGNTAGTPPGAVSNEADVVVTIVGPGTLVKKGHSFTEWNTAADGSGKTYSPNGPYTIAARNDTLCAQWEINRYTVAYRGNGSDGGTVPLRTTHRYTTEVTIAAETPTRAGYTFYRWNTDSMGNGEDYKPGDKFTIGDKDVTLYARWMKNLYRLDYNASGATGGTVPAVADIPFGDSVKVAPQGTLVRTGWSFTGWNTKADGSGIAYPADTTIAMGAEDLELFAQWQVNGYTVIFDARGGSPAKTERAANYGDTVTAPAVSKTGYSLENWYRDSACTNVWDFADDTVTGDMTLYAKWTINTYPVTYDANNATGGTVPAAQTKTHGVTLTLANNTGNLTRTGYAFTGWNTLANGSGTDYVAGAGYTANEAVVLYAKWTINTYPVTYNANNATGGTIPAAQTKTHGVTLTLAGNTGSLARTGYAFTGWNTAADGSGTSYSAGGSYTANEGVVLYARWTADTYPVTYDANGADGGTIPAAQTKTHGVTLTLAGNTGSLTRTGYAFTGWNTLANGSGTDYAAGAGYTANEALVLYAKWMINTYPVTYDANNATGGAAPAAQTKTHDVALTLAGNSGSVIRTGYSFAGWNTAANGSGTSYTTGGSYAANAAVVLYARWIITDIDGNIYTEVQIGNQVWMVENLKTTRYRDGTVIPRVTDPTAWSALISPGFCWYNNDSSTYNVTYGILYNWYTVADTNTHRIAPAGWHVPSDAEWTELSTYLGGESVAGGKMKEAGIGHWNSPNTGATNESGFSAFPGGYRNFNGTFYTIGDGGTWWSATEYDATSAWYRFLTYYSAILTRNNTNKWFGFSVRCLRD